MDAKFKTRFAVELEFEVGASHDELAVFNGEFEGAEIGFADDVFVEAHGDEMATRAGDGNGRASFQCATSLRLKAEVEAKAKL